MSARSGRPGTRPGSGRPCCGSGRPAATSRSMSTTSPSPRRTLAVIRAGRPNDDSPRVTTESPFTTPDGRAGRGDQDRAASDVLERRAPGAVTTAPGPPRSRPRRRQPTRRSRPALAARSSASRSRSVSRRMWVESRSASPARRDARSTIAATAPASSGRSARTAGDRAQQPRVPGLRVGRARDLLLEVHLHLEQLEEVGVQLRQQVVDGPVARPARPWRRAGSARARGTRWTGPAGRPATRSGSRRPAARA